MIFIIDKAIEGGYNAQAVSESIYTQAETIDELHLNIAGAISCHFDGPIYRKFKLIFA